MNNILRSCVVLFVVCSVCVSALAYVNEVTKGPIQLRVEEAENEANKEIFPEADEFKSGTAAISEESIITDITEAYKSGEKLGYIVKVTQKGFGGPINMVTGIKRDGSVAGIAILSQSETAGLGAECEKQWFRDRFKDKRIFPLSVVKNGAEENEIDAITSATITSKHVTEAVNTAHEWFETEGGGAW